MTSQDGTEDLLHCRGGAGFARSCSVGSLLCRRVHTFRLRCENVCVGCG